MGDGALHDKKDFEKAAGFYRKACGNGHAEACRSLGLMYKAGLGVKEDALKANEFYQKACDAGSAEVCNDLGFRYAVKGLDAEKDTEFFMKAAEFFKKACNGGYGAGCGNLGRLYERAQGVKQNINTALEYYGKACDLKEQDACDDYARLKK
jgi:TPR repeat protein